MWSVYGEKICGNTHAIKNMECQDAFGYITGDGYVIAAVADGHGSPSCPFSRDGAETAVAVALEILENAARDCDGVAMKSGIDIHIPKKIDFLWKKRINELHSTRVTEAVTREGYKGLEKNEEKKADSDIWLLYGTTLLCLVVMNEYCFSLQLGDGDILSVNDDGETEWIIEPIPTHGSETESLCQKEAWQNMRSGLLPLTEPPAMFLIATDGYNNSFSDASEFLKVGRDYLEKARTDGFDSVKAELNGWISETSKDGSGDDITLVIIYRE